jgi:hypothetical protein
VKCSRSSIDSATAIGFEIGIAVTIHFFMSREAECPPEALAAALRRISWFEAELSELKKLSSKVSRLKRSTAEVLTARLNLGRLEEQGLKYGRDIASLRS